MKGVAISSLISDILPESLENPSGKLIEQVRSKALTHTALPAFDYTQKIKVILTDPWLIDFFIRHPTRWVDLSYKIQKLYASNSQKILSEKEKDILLQEIFPILVSPERKQTSNSAKKKPDWNTLKSVVRSDIVENRQLLGYAISETPRSFVESPSSSLSSMRSSENLGHYIVSLLKRQNTNNSKPLTQFNEVFRLIIENIKSIYNIDIADTIPEFKSVGTFTDLEAPAEYLFKGIRSDDPKKREMTTLFLHALYAWGNVGEIQRHIEHAKKAQKHIWTMIEKFGSIGAIKISPASSLKYSEEGCSGECYIEVKGKKHKIKIESRVKSLRSTLIKLMGEESYGNIESIKDMLGFRIFLKDVPREDWSDIIGEFEGMYGAGSYIMKNKNLISTDEIDTISHRFDNSNTPPSIGVKKQRTASGFQNLSYSGYLNERITQSEVGFEVQFFEDEESANPLGEGHHNILDAKKIVQGWVRNMHFVTLPQILAIFRREMNFDPQTMKSPSGLTLAGGVMSFLSSMGTLFLDEETHSVFFSVRGYEHLTRESFPGLREYKIEGDIEKMIRNLLVTTSQVRTILGNISSSPSTPGTSSPLRDQDGGSEDVTEGAAQSIFAK